MTVLVVLALAAAVRMLPVRQGVRPKRSHRPELPGGVARAESVGCEKTGGSPKSERIPRVDPGRPVMRAMIGGVATAAAVLLVQPGSVIVAGCLGSAAGAAIRWAARRSGPGVGGRSFGLTLCLHLWAAALVAGSAPGTGLRVALAAVAPLSKDDAELAGLARVVAQLHLGADPSRVWGEFGDDTKLGPIPAAAARSAVAGGKLANVVDEQLGALDRADLAAAQGRAARSAVAMAGPLGLCFLPAFICLGLVPVVIALLETIDVGR